MRMVHTKLRKGYAGRRDREDENGCAYAGPSPDPQVGDRACRLGLRWHRWQPLALLAAALADAIGLYNIIKPLVGRPRPPPPIWIGHFSGAAFPSGHATQSVACYATLAVVLGTGRSARAKTVLWSTAALVALTVGASRVYLGAHWLTDVLGGYTLGASWVAAVIIVMITASSPRTGEAKLADPGSGSRRRAKRDTR